TSSRTSQTSPPMRINREAHLKNREWMAAALAREIFGPGGHFEDWKNDLYGPSEEISVGPETVFSSWEEYNRQRHVQKNTGEEILKDEQSAKRYGVGLLFPDEGESTDDKE